MEPPLIISTTGPTNHHNNHPGSPESSPRSASQLVDWGDDPLPQVPGAKLRLMCSYGGHIIPRPHDKSLCYVGGETRMVVVERNSSFSDLCTRLSRTLLDRRGFTLKYQLPNEELDSLISVATNEDLENMIEEYDRITNSPLKPATGRLRLFLFLAKPETAQTMGVLLDDAKSETWFVDAINGANLLPRGLSDSVANDLLSIGSGVTETETSSQVDPVLFSSDVADHHAKIAPQQDIHSIQSAMPDSPMMETSTSSFDSSTSSPSMAHLPPIRVRVDEGGGTTKLPEAMRTEAFEEQLLSQLRVTPVPVQPPAIAVPNVIDSNQTRVISDDERSDHAAPVVSRKPPLPLHLHLQPGHRGFNLPPSDLKYPAGYDLPSPDSVKSDSSIASATSQSKATVHQDLPAQQHPSAKPNNDPRTDNSAFCTQNQPTQDPNTLYLYPPPPPQQSPVQPPNMHYIPSYHPVYATQQPLLHPQVEHQHQHQHQHQQQYPMYLLQTQPYNSAVQQPSSSARPSAQFQQQYVSYTTAGQPMCNYEYGHEHHHQRHLYYAPPGPIPVVASQYQSMTPAQAAMIAEASMQLPATDPSNQTPRTS